MAVFVFVLVIVNIIMKEEYRGFALCTMQECALKDKCERAKGFLTLEETDKTFMCVNPVLATGKEDCPMARVAKPTKLAYGFINLLDMLPKKISDLLAEKLRFDYGRNPYYERRRGDRALYPEEQEMIINYLKNNGVDVPEDPFDRYEVVDIV